MFEQFTEMDLKESDENAEFYNSKNMENTENDTRMNIDGESSSTKFPIPNPQGQTNKNYNNIDNLKQIIYKTYSKSIDKSKELQKKERKKMKKLMNLLIYLQMKKIELKLNYFNEFEKLVQYEKQQIKSMESQVMGDRINLAMKKSEISNLSNKLKELLKSNSEFSEINMGANLNILEKAENTKIDFESKIMDLS